VEEHLVPLGRVQQVLADLFGVRLARGSLVGWIQQAAQCQFTPESTPPLYGQSAPRISGQSALRISGQSAPRRGQASWRLSDNAPTRLGVG
jgi:hypothetical protein